MDLHTLKVAEGSIHSGKKVGRGLGSGMGKTSCRGQKGAGARSGAQLLLDLKVAASHYTDVYQKEVSKTLTVKNMQLLMLALLKFSKTEQQLMNQSY